MPQNQKISQKQEGAATLRPILLILGGVILILALSIRAQDPTDSSVEAITGFVLRGSNGVTVAKTGHLVTITGSGGGGGGSAQTEFLRAYYFSAYGSTDTMIPRFATTITNTFAAGTATYTTNAANGTTFTVLKPGVYALTTVFHNDGTGEIAVGFSLNSTELSTRIDTINPTNRLGNVYVASGNGITHPSFSVTLPLASNDVIRPHTSGATPGSGGEGICNMTITKVNN